MAPKHPVFFSHKEPAISTLPGPPPLPAAPPTQPGLIRNDRPTSWPSVIGVICIVIGGLGTLSGLGNLVSVLFIMPWANAMTASARQGSTVDLNQGGPLSIVIAVLGALLSVMLVVGGASLLKRRPWSPTCLRAYSILKILFGILSAVIAFTIMKSQFGAFESQGGPKPPAGLMNALAIFGVGVAVLWSAALPVFLLVWFSRPTIRRETAGWSAQ